MVIDFSNIPGIFQNDYLEMDYDLFTQNLCILLNYYVDSELTYQEVLANIKTDDTKWPRWNQRREERYLKVISKYPYKSEDVSKTTDKPYIDYYGAPSLFSYDPLNVFEDDLVIDFSPNKSLKKIKLGHLENNIFIPKDFNYSKGEIIHNNPYLEITTMYIKAIINYKLTNEKAVLTQDDMNIILNTLYMRKDELNRKLLDTLKAITENTLNILEELSINDVLKLKR